MTDNIFTNINSQEGVLHCVTHRDTLLPLEGSLARHTGQKHEAVTANRSRVEHFFGFRARFVSPMQVHGDHVHAITELRNQGWERLDRDFQADALVTDLPGMVLSILTADCVPILLYDPLRRAIGAVHAGWRGTQMEIVPKTIEKMTALYGSDPKDLIVGIGPAIGGCCYEVDQDVARHFRAYPKPLREKRGGKYFLDTKRINEEQLMGMGVPMGQIEISPYCTSCDVDRYFSYRAEQGSAGRFMSCIMLKA